MALKWQEQALRGLRSGQNTDLQRQLRREEFYLPELVFS